MKRKGRYVPNRGDAVWITLDPQAGHGRVGLALFCPITSQVKGYPFEVPVPAGLAVKGVVLADQIKSLDWASRKVRRICVVPDRVVAQVLARINALLTK